MLSILPALRATRPRGQASFAHLGAGGATLRFGRVWTGAMIFQVALTAMGIPVGMETVNEAMLKHGIRAAFPSGPYLAARVELSRPLEDTAPAFEARRTQALAALERRVAQEPGVIGIAFSENAPASLGRERFAEVEAVSGAGTVSRSPAASARRRSDQASSICSIDTSLPGAHSTRATGTARPGR